MKPTYDEEKLARLMEEAGVDLILAHTPHNIRYLTGGYYFHFRERVAAIGPSQYLPFVGIPRDNPENAFQVAWRVEASPRNEVDTWIPDVIYTKARGTIGAAETAAEAVRKRGLDQGTIAVERAFMPVDAMEALARELGGARFVDSLGVLEELRAVKREDELEIFRRAALADSEAIQAGFREGARGVTTRRIEQKVEEEMVRRGLHFHYAFTAAGPAMRREPSDKIWEKGEILHIDAGGSEAGYMSDICRMGVRGEPSALADELHKACLHAVDACRGAIRAGASCAAVHERGHQAFADTGFADSGIFEVHGIGMVQQELPRFGPEVERALEAGMVVSVECDIRHAEVGHVKIEDAVAVTGDGCEGLGDLGRDSWTCID